MSESPPIQLIDDNHDILEIVAIWLRRQGWTPHPFDNARDALRALDAGLRPRLILLDLYMPGMTGFQFRAVQLADDRLASIPVVVLSGHIVTEDDRAKLAAAQYLTKPVESRVLLASIDRHRVPTHLGAGS
jgi:two-component system, OmpR family, phosphate regulon response regulator PhoB